MSGDTLDLELCLGIGPRDGAVRSINGAAPEGIRVDLSLSTGERKDAAYGEARQRVEQAMAAVSDHDATTEQPTSDGGEGEEAAAEAEQGSKRVKTEPPAATVAIMPPPLRAQREKANNLNPPAAHHQGDGGATEPAWVRAELLPRHALPGDLPLHFVQEKVLTKSDLKSDQSRLLILSGGSERLRALLSAGELSQCGLDGARRTRKKPAQGQDDGGEKKRNDRTRYPGVAVLVYERGRAERAAAAAAELRLNSFCSTKAMVINGQGYGRFAAGSGFRQGHRVEVWAFRRPHDQHLCFVIAKRDDHRRTAAIRRQE